MIIRDANVADAPGIARVNVDTWRSTYRGIVPDDFLDRLGHTVASVTWEARIKSGTNTFTIVAVDDDAGNVIGYVSGGMERSRHPEYDGEVYAIYVLEEFQGNGIGRALLIEGVRRLRALGFKSMLIWVLDENLSGCRFYERMGGAAIAAREIVIGGATLGETAYGWESLENFEF
jgi:ribosomal protein S18 acetylase RimI-like enzyme